MEEHRKTEDDATQPECPFCVMMRKGGCEAPFQEFMACGEKADKGGHDMADCVKYFEALHVCMESNKAVFDSILDEMRSEEAAAIANAAPGPIGQEEQQASPAGSAAQAAAGPSSSPSSSHSTGDETQGSGATQAGSSSNSSSSSSSPRTSTPATVSSHVHSVGHAPAPA